MRHFKLSFLVCMLLLCSCGFHLSQQYANLDKKFPILALPATGSNTFHQALFRAMQASHIKLVDKARSQETPTLIVVSQQLSEQPLVYGPDSELSRERLTMDITFAFTSQNTQQFTLSTTRDRQLNSNQYLGDNAEKIIIEQEMQADIINQLLRFLASRPF